MANRRFQSLLTATSRTEGHLERWLQIAPEGGAALMEMGLRPNLFHLVKKKLGTRNGKQARITFQLILRRSIPNTAAFEKVTIFANLL